MGHQGTRNRHSSVLVSAITSAAIPVGYSTQSSIDDSRAAGRSISSSKRLTDSYSRQLALMSIDTSLYFVSPAVIAVTDF